MLEYLGKAKVVGLLILTISLITTLALTAHSSLASAQNKTSMQPQGMTANTAKMNIVLVHGTAVDGSSWSKVIPILQKAGHKVIAVQLALHSLADDIATVKRAIDLVGAPVLLVGHSYGGFVITNAAYNNPAVKGLVYLAAFAPKEGQSLGNFLGTPAKGFAIVDSGGFIYINQTIFGPALAQDVDPAQAKIVAEKSGPPAWKQLPTWYQVSENDHAIPPAVERMFAKQINATTISLASSHVSPLSHPNEVAQFILGAANNLTRGAGK
jgi:pimeloyl-ACP methyl ester carboxylesterase